MRAVEKYGHKLKSSIRAKYATVAIEYTLRQCTKKSKEAYKLHIVKLNTKLAQDKAIAKRKLQEAKNDLRINEAQFFKYQNFQLEHPEDYTKHHRGKLELHQNLVNAANASIKQSEAELEKLNTSLPTEAEFYELIKSYLFTILNTSDLMEEDVYNEVVLNLRAGDNIVSVVNLNKPYDLLLDLSKIVTGRDVRILLELFKYITENPDQSQRLLNNLRIDQPRKTQPVEALVF